MRFYAAPSSRKAHCTLPCSKFVPGSYRGLLHVFKAMRKRARTDNVEPHTNEEKDKIFYEFYRASGIS